ncbi:hypothetical protein [Chryseobacterium sp. MP_3.2]|uniref:hypothetical protein n=1 Tax=Chryseobacterium sp. MP_3.2 TaxID=3071712 RepID=UPI002E0C96BE|nr:hypothetical protein [Chryseobacterium sp. MP_3.2]
MVIKNYLILAGSALLLQNCQNTVNSATTTDNENEKLTRVEWSTYGGQRGYVEKMVITKDSILHSSFTTMNDNETVENKYKNSPEKWRKLVDAFQISDFKKVKDGESKLAFDGVDQKLIVRTATDADSLVNGFEDKVNFPKIEKFAKLVESIRAENK